MEPKAAPAKAFQLTSLVPGWQRLRILSANPALVSSAAAVVLIPLFARIATAIATHSNWQEVLAHILISAEIQIPGNLLRLYWGSLLVLVAQTSVSLLCPRIVSHYPTFSLWREECEDGIKSAQKLRHELGSGKEQDAEAKLKIKYFEEFSHQATRWTAARLLITTIFVIGGYMLFRVVLEQANAVLAITALSAIFP